MQEIETATNTRTDRDVQVIPIDPALRMRRWLFISGIIVLLLYIIDVYFTSSGVSQENSCLHIAGFYYVIFTAAALFALSQWKALDKRRQQAARYLLVTGASRNAVNQPPEGISDLPEIFAIRSRRRWSGTCMLIVLCALLLSVPGIVVYAYWRGSSQAIQQGLPAAFVILQNGLNIVIWLLLLLLVVGMLIFAPRQELIATREGLTCRRGYRLSFIPWSQARLFAVIGQPDSEHTPAFYELASQNTLIRWPAHLSRQPVYGRPVGVMRFASSLARPEQPSAEFPQQVQFLNIIIAERTGLPLYDLR